MILATGPRAVSALGVALVAALLAPASASASPSDICAPGTTLTPTYQYAELEQKAPLVATHEMTVIAEFSDRVRNLAVSAPDGVHVLGKRGGRLKLIVPVSASLAMTATWVQANNPSDPDSDPDDPATNCTATVTTALPITSTRPSTAIYVLKASDGYAAFAVTQDLRRGDVSPLEISIRVTAKARFPSEGAKARTMAVAMRPSERVHYKRHIPQEEFATTPMRCRFYYLTCGGPAFVQSWATELRWRSPGRWTKKSGLHGGGLLSYLQPFRIVAPYGVMVNAIVGTTRNYKPPAFAYDVQVHQSGQLVGRARVAGHCRKEPTRFGESFYRCHPVRRAFG
jgi:hypothetical protein